MAEINNSSLQVKPSELKKSELKKFKFLKVKQISEEECILNFTNNILIKVSQLENDIINLQIIYNDKIIIDKIEHNLKKQKINFNSKKIYNKKFSITINDNETLIIKNKKNKIIIKSIYIKDKFLNVNIQTWEDEKFYGFGEKTGMNLDKKFSDTSNYAVDLYKAHSDQDLEMYGAVNFNIINKGIEKNVGIFVDNPSRTKYDMKNNEDFIIGVQENDLDLYFILEDSIKNVLKKYYQLTGFPLLPTKWGLGHHLSKHSYENTNVIKNLLLESNKNKIKLDAIYLDIQYMNNYKTFTVDENRFENLSELVSFCRENGVEIIPIVNPGVKASSEFYLYNLGLEQDAFMKKEDGVSIYTGEVWPGQCAFPDFFNKRGNEFWTKAFDFYLKKGIRGIWLDMNEPAIFNNIHTLEDHVIHDINGKKIPHSHLHNNYGTYETRATYNAIIKNNLRPHIVTRAFSAGIQKFSTIWTGDNFSYWFQLEQSLPMIMNLGLSGVPFAGQDIGGFEYDASAELLTRWYQANILFGLFRNHCSINRREQEPWTFNKKTTQAIAKATEFRNKYLPTIYSHAYQVSSLGVGNVVPLFYSFEKDVEAYNIDNQYMVSNFMVAPILRKNTFQRIVYLPDNKKGWIDFESKKYLNGKQFIIKEIAYDQMGLFVENNSMLFSTNPNHKKDDFFKKIIVEIYNFNNCNETIEGKFFDDNGLSLDSISSNNFEHINFKYKNNILTFESINKKIDLVEIKKKFNFVLISENENKELQINGGKENE